MKFDFNFKKLVIFIIASIMCLSVFAFLPTVSATDYYVNPGDDVQSVINAAAAYDTIHFAPGIYPNMLSINKPLTLLGANAGIHPTVGVHPTETVGTRGPETILSHNGLYAIRPSADYITIDGFKFTGSGGRIIDTYDNANFFSLLNCIFDNPGDHGPTGNIQFGGGSHKDLLFAYNIFIDGGYHTFYTGGGPYDRMHIIGNKFNGYGEAIFWAASPLIDAVVEYNEFDGVYDGIPGNGGGYMNIGQAGNIIIRNNWFHDLFYTGSQVGIINGEVTDNIFQNIYPYPGYWGTCFELWGGQYGTAESTNVLVERNDFYYNEISGAAEPTHGLRLRAPDTGTGIDGSTIHVHNTNFYDGEERSDAYGIWHEASGIVDADCNWWSDVTGPYDPTINPGGLGSDLSGEVDFICWLDDIYPNGDCVGGCCIPDINMNPGYDPDAVCSAGARWRNLRTDGNGWELAVGDPAVIGSYDPGWANLDFVYSGDYFFSPDGPNIFTFTYDAITGDQTIEANVNGGLFTQTQNNGNLGALNYLQIDVVGRNGQTVLFNNVILTVDSISYNLCDFEAGDWLSWYNDSLDLTNGFSITGEAILVGQAASQEGSKINILAGITCMPVCRNVEDDITFCSIQAAIDSSTTDDGETIEVYPGTHPGNILVYKELTIESQSGAASTTIDASVVDYSTYQNSYGHGIDYTWAETYDPGLLKNGFMIWSNNVVIDGFEIINAAWPSQYNRGIGVLIGSIHTTYAGFIPWNIDQWGGLISPVDEPTPTGVIIKNNIIDGASDGIYNWMSNGNTFEYNNIMNTVAYGGNGLQCYEGGTDNIIHGNTMDNIAGAGISICGAWPDVLLDCSNTLVYENTITNSNWGIQFYNMGGSGVEAYYNNLLDNNRGIVIEGAGDATVGIAYENNLVGNSQYGIINSCPTGTFIASCNWWGASDGPSTIGPGTGDTVSSNVNFCPWLDAAYPSGNCVGGLAVTADAGGIYIDNDCDLTVTFDGSGTTDDSYCGVGTISYSWDFGDGKTGDGMTPTHTYAAAGQYSVVLTATISNGISGVSDINGAIANVYGVVADIGGPYYADTTGYVQFDASGSSGYDTPFVYKWDFGDYSGWHNNLGPTPSYTYVVPEDTLTRTVTVEVIDKDGYCVDYDSTTVRIPGLDEDPPLIQLNYPRGGEILSGTVTVDYYAIDDDYPGEENNDLPIYIYYSANDGETWREITDDLPLRNEGDYSWNTNNYADGEYKILVEAVDKRLNIAHESSDSFTINNGNAGAKVSDVSIKDITINSENYIKDGDTLQLTAGITGSINLNIDDITADLTPFGLGENVKPSSFDGFIATWTVNNVVCNPSNGVLTIKVTISDYDSSTDTIIADNTKPELEILKPLTGLYLFNSKVLQLQRTVIIGPFTIIVDGTDANGIEKTEFYIDGELMYIDTKPDPEWYMNIKQKGQHNIEIKLYDNVGNSISESTMITVFNFFGN